MTKRYLLPFTHGVDTRVIDFAVSLAYNQQATLVPLALIAVPAKGARLEDMQQAMDFLEAVRWRAKRYQATVDLYEVYTANSVQSILSLTAKLACERVMVFMTEKYGALLSTHETASLMEERELPLLLIRLPAKRSTGWRSFFEHRPYLLAWLHSNSGQVDVMEVVSVAPAYVPAQISHAIRTEQLPEVLIHGKSG